MVDRYQSHERSFVTRRYLDPQKGEYVDQELPTVTVKLLGPEKRNPVRSPAGTIEGSYRVTGSHYDLAPGTYSLRITRLNLAVTGTAVFPGGSHLNWYLRHSRVGTIHVESFSKPDTIVRVGDPLRPIMSLGPGTVFFAYLQDPSHADDMGTHMSLAQALEGVLG